MKATVIGAGITGLTLAHRLGQLGHEVCLIEKQDRVGGVIRTMYEDGFRFETGPNTGVMNNNRLVELFDDVAPQCRPLLARPEAKRRLILQGNSWKPLPSGPISAISTDLFSFADKLRLLGEPWRRPGTDPDETLSRLVVRRMGRTFLTNAVDPFVSGVYAGDPDKLVTRYAMPKLYNLEQRYGSFIGGSIRKARADKAAGIVRRFGKEVFSTPDGLQGLVDAVAALVGHDNIICGCADVSVRRTGGRFETTFVRQDQQQTVTSDVVAVATNAPQIPDIVSDLPGELTQSIAQMTYAPVMLAVAGYRRWTGKPLAAFGGLVPSAQRRNVLGILFPSAIFGGRAPVDGALLSVFMGGVRRPDLLDKSDEDVRNLIIDEVYATLHERAEPDLFRIYRHRQAIPQYDISCGRRMELIERAERDIKGLYIAGNIHNGIGIGDRVCQAYDYAERIDRENPKP